MAARKKLTRHECGRAPSRRPSTRTQARKTRYLVSCNLACAQHPIAGDEATRRWSSAATVLLALAVLFVAAGCKPKRAAQASPPEVQVITLTPTNVPLFEEWVGTLDGFVNAQIRAQVTGYLLTQNYAEGSAVSKGDLLFQIDPRPFQAALDQAKAKLAQDQAQEKKSQLDVQRFTPLASDQAISQQDLDNAVQAEAAARAQVQADRAAIETAELNVAFTRITAPVDGLAGLAQVQIGDFVGPASGVLTTVSTLNPIKVYFQVSEQSYLKFWKQFAGSMQETNRGAPKLELILSDGSAYPKTGRFYFVDRQINVNTGTLQVAGLFPNEGLLLRPGQYARTGADPDPDQCVAGPATSGNGVAERYTGWQSSGSRTRSGSLQSRWASGLARTGSSKAASRLERE